MSTEVPLAEPIGYFMPRIKLIVGTKTPFNLAFNVSNSGKFMKRWLMSVFIPDAEDDTSLLPRQANKQMFNDS